MTKSDFNVPRRIALLSGLFVAAVGFSVLVGWALDIKLLRSALSFGVAMRANVALGMLICGLALAVLSLPNPGNPGRAVAAGAGVVVAVFATLSLSQDLFGWDFGIDQWLVRDTTATSRFAVPGRMSPPAAFCLLLLGIAILAATRPAGAKFRTPVLLALSSTLVLVGAVALLGQLAERWLEVRFLSYSRIAAYAALEFTLLGCGLLALVRSEGRLAWSLDAVTTGGFAAGLAAMVLTAGVSYQFTSEMRNDAVRVNHTLELLKEIQKLNRLLADFTISAGRYIITRDERTLAGREETKTEVRNSLALLRGLADTEGQKQLLDRIDRLHARRIAMSDDIIVEFRQRILSGNLPAAGEPSPLGQVYPALGVEIERLMRLLEAEVYAALERRQKRADLNARATFLLLPLGVFIGMALLALGLFVLNAGAGERRRAQDAVARNGKRLEVLHEIDLAIIAAKTPEQIAQATLPRLRDLLGLPRVVVNLFDLEKREAEWLAAVGRRRSHVGPRIRYPLDLMGDLEGLQRGDLQLIEVAALAQRNEAEALLASDVRWYMVVPMIVGGELIGGLSFGGPSREFPPEQTEIARQVAAQLAIAIAQSRLSERARRADAHYRLIVENVPVGITMTAADGRFVSMNSALPRILGYDSVEDAMAGANGRAQGLYADPGARDAYLEILQRDGVVTGFETRFRRKNGDLVWVSMGGRPVDDLRGPDSMVVTIIDDISLRKEHEHRIGRLNRVKEMQSGVNSIVVRARGREELFRESCRIAVETGQFKMAWIGVADWSAMKIVPVASAGADPDFLKLIEERFSLREDAPMGNTKTARAIREKKAYLSNDIGRDSTVLSAQERIERGIRSMAVFPLLVSGDAVAALVLYADEVDFFDSEEVKLLTELVDDIAFAMDNMHKQERLEYLSYYDALTGLPNRSLFHDRTSHSLHARGAETRLIAVVLLDLERFRRVNETMGRKVGDELLREVGARLTKASDSAARIGVDMFGLVLRGARTAPEVHRALETILAAVFSVPFSLAGEDLRIGCRAGVAVFPNDGNDADALLKNAEAALRRSKREGERVVFYAPEMNARAAEALAIETRLRGAIERHEFVLHYQPKVALADGRITGAEALIRWQEPGKGLVPPGKFIPILEETGMIVEVGRWAVEQAFVDLRVWAAQGIKVPRVAVNVSSIQLQRNDFVDTMVDEIARGGDNPEWLELEITESLVMRNVEDSIRKLSILRGMGVTVAIDDFGTGYSSLSYLGRLPVDTLKVDRSFISNVATSADSTTLVTTVITLAHGLKLKAVAEGVETIEQANTLRLFRCDEAQGYYYSRPVPAAEIGNILRAGSALPAAKGAAA